MNIAQKTDCSLSYELSPDEVLRLSNRTRGRLVLEMAVGATCFVFKRKRRRGGKLVVAERYTARIGLSGDRPRAYPTPYTDKRAAEAWQKRN